jgi:hypothetical protein
MINYYVLPVVLALVLNLSVLCIAGRDSFKNALLYNFIVASTLFNLSELLLFVSGFQSGLAAEFILKLYYVIAFFNLAVTLNLIFDITRLIKNEKYKAIGLYAYYIATFLAILTVSTKKILAGSFSLKYSITAVRGDFYWMFQSFSLFVLAIGLFSLILGIMIADNTNQKTRCVRLTIAYMPYLLACIVVVILMALGIQLNATAILPATSTFFLCFLFFSERSHHLTSIMKLVPGTLESRFSNAVSELADSFAAEELSLQDAEKKMERLMVLYAYEKYRGNVYRSSKNFDIRRPSFYAKLKKFGVNLNKKTESFSNNE